MDANTRPLEELTLYQAVSRYVRSVQRKADYPNIVGRARKLMGRDPEGSGRPPWLAMGERWHLDPDMDFHALTNRDVNHLRHERATEGNAEATINHEVKVLSATYHLMQKEGVRVPSVIEFPQVKVPGKLRWFTEEEVARLLVELDPDLEFWGRRGRMKGVKITLNPVVQRQRQDAYDLAVVGPTGTTDAPSVRTKSR